MNTHMKARFFVTVFIVLLLGTLSTGCSGVNGGSAVSQPSSPDASAVYAVINGEDITYAELDYYKLQLRSQVTIDIIEQFSVEYSADFWQIPIDGTTPEQRLCELALNECRVAKIKLVLCRENGIYTDISFNGLKALANEYNLSKVNSAAAGLKSIDLDSFYTYYIDTGVMQLKNILAEGKLKPAEDEVQQFIMSMPQNQIDSLEGESPDAYAQRMLVSQKFDALIAQLLNESSTVITGSAEESSD